MPAFRPARPTKCPDPNAPGRARQPKGNFPFTAPVPLNVRHGAKLQRLGFEFDRQREKRACWPAGLPEAVPGLVPFAGVHQSRASQAPPKRRYYPSTSWPHQLPHMVTLTWPGVRNVRTTPPRPTTSWPPPVVLFHMECEMTEPPLPPPSLHFQPTSWPGPSAASHGA